jgi:predicted MPP superfamily phosphohydrolase
MDSIKKRFLAMQTPGIVVYSIFIYILLIAISNLFQAEINILLLTLAIGLSNYLSLAIESIKSNIITRFTSSLTEVIKWIALMYGFLTLVVYIIQLAILIPKNILILIYLTIVPILAIYAYINAHRIIIIEHELKIKNLKEEIKILHLSDLHIGSIRNTKLMENVVLKINNTDADLAIISGDLADGTCAITEDSFLPLKNSKIPMIFTPGNHDLYPGIEIVLKASKKANLNVLLDDKIEFKGVNIYGYPLTKIGRNLSIDEKEIEISSDEVNLLINHLPLGWEYFRNKGINLQLSGHTHGGQFYPFNLLVKLAFPYLKGLYYEDGAYLSVTEGVGTLSPPMRFGTHSEIVLLNLKSKFKK